MFDWLRHRLLRFLRVPAEPQPPFGAPGSVRMFRAGRNYYKLRLARWGVTQLGAVAGIIFSLWFFDQVQAEVAARRATAAKPSWEQAAAPATPAVAPASAQTEPAAAETSKNPKPGRTVPRDQWKKNSRHGLARVVAQWPGWIFPLLYFFECGTMALFLAQIPVTLAVVRLEYEQHWYIVTDRSLRIRTGIFQLTESTMSFANLQQVEVKQGPLQRLLGLADVRVQSAGGGGSGHDEKSGGDSLHTGIFHSVENAAEIRDLILARLRQFRAAGLGDPDDPNLATGVPPATTAALAAAREMLAEARALRQSLASPPSARG